MWTRCSGIQLSLSKFSTKVNKESESFRQTSVINYISPRVSMSAATARRSHRASGAEALWMPTPSKDLIRGDL